MVRIMNTLVRNIFSISCIVIYIMILVIVILSYGLLQNYKIERTRFVSMHDKHTSATMSRAIFSNTKECPTDETGVNYKENYVYIRKNNQNFHFDISTNENAVSSLLKGLYDIHIYPSINYFADSINSDFHINNLFTHTEFILKDSTDRIIESTEINKKSFGERVKGATIELGFIRKHKLEVYYTYPFNNYVHTAIYDIFSTVLIGFVLCILIMYFKIQYRREKKIQDEIKESSAQMAHNMRNPIEFIKRINERSIKNALNPKEQDYRQEAIEKCNIVINNINHFLKIVTNNTVSLNITQCNIKDIFEDIREIYLSIYRQSARNSKIVSIEITDINKDIIVMADKCHLTTVISNLVENSIKYSGDEVNIVLSAYEQEKYYYIEVKDNGFGFGKKITRSNSFGIGLRYIKLVVKAHKWILSINNNIDKGASITIKIRK